MVEKLEQIAGQIKIIELKEFLFSPEQVQNFPIRFNGENSIAFVDDLESGKLRCYDRSFVVYRKSVFSGQSKQKIELYTAAVQLYGVEDVAVFDVPTEAEEPDFRKATGIFLIPSKFLLKYLKSLRA